MEYIKIPLGNTGKFTLVDGDYDGEYFSQYKWKVNSVTGYAFRKKGPHEDEPGKYVALHRLVQKCPKGMWVDHINRDKLDNRSCNLRISTPQQNSWNRIRKKGKYKYIGVSKAQNGTLRDNGTRWLSPKFRALFRGKHLGMFDTPEEAGLAWDAEARKIYGEFGVYNFPIVD